MFNTPTLLLLQVSYTYSHRSDERCLVVPCPRISPLAKRRVFTPFCQRLQANCEDKIREFHQFVIWIQEEKQYILSQIGNTDQTAMKKFDMPRSTSVETKGARTVYVRSVGAEKQRCTITVTVGGRKLPLFVNFKRKMFP